MKLRLLTIGLALSGFAYAASPSGPLFFMNLFGPLGQPQYQLVAYTGSLTPPVSTQVSTLTMNTTDIFQSANWSYYNPYETALATTKTTPFYGFLTGSLVANGYMATSLVTAAPSSTSTIQPFLLGISSGVTIGHNASAGTTTTVGLTDIAELCKRFGFATAHVTVNQYCWGGLQRWFSHEKLIAAACSRTSFDVLTFPFVMPLNQKISTFPSTDGRTMAQYWFSMPIVLFNSNSNLSVYEPTAWMYWDNNNGQVSTTLNALSFMPLCVSEYAQVQNISAILGQPITADQIILSPNCNGVYSIASGNLIDQDQCCSNESCDGNYVNCYGIPACLSLFPKVGLGLLSPDMITTAQLRSADSFFQDLFTWFDNNVNFTFPDIITLKKELASNSPVNIGTYTSLMSMYGASPNSSVTSASTGTPYNQAYANLLTKLGTPAVSATLNPATITSVAVPSAGSTGSAMTTEYFDTLGVYIPLLMADPCNKIKLSPHQTGAPFYYPGMVVHAWVKSKNEWVMGNGATQQINYSGGQAASEFGQAQVTDFDPRKSMMSDYYNLLSY